MKVILLENVRKVGSIGEIIDVKRGYARNYLISQKKALFASKANIKEVDKIKSDLSLKVLDIKNLGYGFEFYFILLYYSFYKFCSDFSVLYLV